MKGNLRLVICNVGFLIHLSPLKLESFSCYVIYVCWSLLQGLQRVHAAFEQAFTEIAESLYISRNIEVALIALHSWKSFVSNWMQAVVSLLDIKESSKLNKALKAASDIFKVNIYFFRISLNYFAFVCSISVNSDFI